jgi:hypothetical protein
MNPYKFIVAKCNKENPNKIYDVHFLCTVSKEQEIAHILYDQQNFPFKINEYTFYMYYHKHLINQTRSNVYNKFLE